MPKIARFAVLFVGIIVVGAALWWWLGHPQRATELRLYGNVDLRQVELPFNGSERIAAVLVQEGDRVRQGQLLGRLDTPRFAPQTGQSRSRGGREAAGSRSPAPRQSAGGNCAGALQRSGRRRRRRQCACAIPAPAIA